MSFPCGRRPNHRFNAQFPVIVRFCFVAFLQTSKDAKFCQDKPFNVQLKIKRKMSPYEIKGCLIRFKFIHISFIYYLKQHITINFFLSVVKIYNGVSLAYAYSFYCTACPELTWFFLSFFIQKAWTFLCESSSPVLNSRSLTQGTDPVPGGRDWLARNDHFQRSTSTKL